MRIFSHHTILGFLMFAFMLVIGACEMRSTTRFGGANEAANPYSMAYRPAFTTVTSPAQLGHYEAVITRQAPPRTRVSVLRREAVQSDGFSPVGEIAVGETQFVDKQVKNETAYAYILIERDEQGEELRRSELSLAIPEDFYLDSRDFTEVGHKPLRYGRFVLGPNAKFYTGGEDLSIEADEIIAAAGSQMFAFEGMPTLDPARSGTLKIRAARATGELIINPYLRPVSAEELSEGIFPAHMTRASGSQAVDIRIRENGNFSVKLAEPENRNSPTAALAETVFYRRLRLDVGDRSWIGCGGRWHSAELLLSIFLGKRTEQGTEVVWLTPRDTTPYFGYATAGRPVETQISGFESVASASVDNKHRLKMYQNAYLVLPEFRLRAHPDYVNPRTYQKASTAQLDQYPDLKRLQAMNHGVWQLDRILDREGLSADIQGPGSDKETISSEQLKLVEWWVEHPKNLIQILKLKKLEGVRFLIYSNAKAFMTTAHFLYIPNLLPMTIPEIEDQFAKGNLAAQPLPSQHNVR